MISQKDRIEAAIRHIQTSLDIDPWAMELAVGALEKQIPMRPKKVCDEIGICPSCDEYVLWHRDVCWCGRCGQAIDFGGLSDEQSGSYITT